MYSLGQVKISKKMKPGKYIFVICLEDLGQNLGGNIWLTWYSNK